MENCGNLKIKVIKDLDFVRMKIRVILLGKEFCSGRCRRKLRRIENGRCKGVVRVIVVLGVSKGGGDCSSYIL